MVSGFHSGAPGYYFRSTKQNRNLCTALCCNALYSVLSTDYSPQQIQSLARQCSAVRGRGTRAKQKSSSAPPPTVARSQGRRVVHPAAQPPAQATAVGGCDGPPRPPRHAPVLRCDGPPRPPRHAPGRQGGGLAAEHDWDQSAVARPGHCHCSTVKPPTGRDGGWRGLAQDWRQ